MAAECTSPVTQGMLKNLHFFGRNCYKCAGVTIPLRIAIVFDSEVSWFRAVPFQVDCRVPPGVTTPPSC
eukprot:6455589-Amphidinium_carterae.2